MGWLLLGAVVVGVVVVGIVVVGIVSSLNSPAPSERAQQWEDAGHG